MSMWCASLLKMTLANAFWAWGGGGGVLISETIRIEDWNCIAKISQNTNMSYTSLLKMAFVNAFWALGGRGGLINETIKSKIGIVSRR